MTAKKWPVTSWSLHTHTSFYTSVFSFTGKRRSMSGGHLDLCISQGGFWGCLGTHWEIKPLSISKGGPDMERGSISTRHPSQAARVSREVLLVDLGVPLLCHKVTLCSKIWGTATVSQSTTLFYFSYWPCLRLPISQPHQHWKGAITS